MLADPLALGPAVGAVREADADTPVRVRVGLIDPGPEFVCSSSLLRGEPAVRGGPLTDPASVPDAEPIDIVLPLAGAEERRPLKVRDGAPGARALLDENDPGRAALGPIGGGGPMDVRAAGPTEGRVLAPAAGRALEGVPVRELEVLEAAEICFVGDLVGD